MSHGKVRDRFDTALRLSAQAEGVQLPDLREEMRPKSKSEVDEFTWGEPDRTRIRMLRDQAWAAR